MTAAVCDANSRRHYFVYDDLFQVSTEERPYFFAGVHVIRSPSMSAVDDFIEPHVVVGFRVGIAITDIVVRFFSVCFHCVGLDVCAAVLGNDASYAKGTAM